MKIKELFEEIEQNDDVISQYVVDYLIALKANGVTKVSTSAIMQEVLKKSDVTINFPSLQKIVGKIPFVSDINKNIVTLSSDDEIGKEFTGDSKETVKDMAQMALKRRRN